MKWKRVNNEEERWDLIHKLGYIAPERGERMSYESCVILGKRTLTEQPCLGLWTRMTAEANRKYSSLKHFVVGTTRCADGATDVICVREIRLGSKYQYSYIITTHKVGCCPCTVYSEPRTEQRYGHLRY